MFARDEAPQLKRVAKERVLDSLLGFLFPKGRREVPDAEPWQTDANGAVPRTAMSLAKDVGRLDALRVEFAVHPHAAAVPMLGLRLEAALAAGDASATEELQTLLRRAKGS